MKKILLLASILLIASCTKDSVSFEDNSQLNEIRAFVADDIQTKVIINDNGDSPKTFSHLWQNGDKISVFDGATNKEYTCTNTSPARVGTFTGAGISASSYYAVFPYNDTAKISGDEITVAFPSVQKYTASSYDPKAITLVGYANSSDIEFKVASSFIQITLQPTANYTVRSLELTATDGTLIAGAGTVDYNSGSPVATVSDGTSTIMVDFGKDGLAMASGTAYKFVIAVPAIAATTDTPFTVAVTATDGKMFFKNTTISLTKNNVVMMPALTAVPTDAVKNLAQLNNVAVSSADWQTANCYVVNEAGTYAIPVDVKGNGSCPTDMTVSKYITNYKTASSVWNDNETAKAVDGTLSIKGNYLIFTATSNHGNALLAVKNAGSKILWSWHIWNTDYVLGTEDRKVSYKTDNFSIMKRILGSNTITGAGLQYFAGRKDPFRNQKPSFTSNQDFAWTVENPDKATDSGSDVNAYSNQTLNSWSPTSKNMLDPSPIGYLVASENAHTAISNSITSKVYSDTEDSYWIVTDNDGETFNLPLCGLIAKGKNYNKGVRDSDKHCFCFYASSTIELNSAKNGFKSNRLSFFDRTDMGTLYVERTWNVVHSGNVICSRVN